MSKLIINSYSETYNNYQYKKNKKASRLIKSYSYNKAYNNYQYNKNRDFKNVFLS